MLLKRRLLSGHPSRRAQKMQKNNGGCPEAVGEKIAVDVASFGKEKSVAVARYLTL